MNPPADASPANEFPAFESLLDSAGKTPEQIDVGDELDFDVDGYDNVVSTGHATLDALLHGGLAVGTTTMLLTDGGDEGEMLLMHMAEGGPTTVILGDRSEAGVLRAWSPFIDTDQVECAYQNDGAAKDRVIVENFSALCHEHGFAAAVRTLTMLVDDTQANGQTTIVHVVRDAHTKPEIARLRSLLDGVIEVIDGTFLVVTKMRGLLVPIRPAGLRKSSEGLMIEAVQRVA